MTLDLRVTMLLLIALILVLLENICWAQTGCCMPAQWESPIGILQGFHLQSSDSSGEMEGVDRISYDYENKRVAGTMTVKSSEYPAYKITSITDFIKKRQYTLIDGRCSVSDLTGASGLGDWECVPESAKFSGRTYFGAGNQKFYTENWTYHIKGMTVMMSYTSPGCIPVSESVVGQINSDMEGVVLVTYTGFTLGIRDPQVFVPPTNCTHTGQTIYIGGSGTLGGIVGRMRRALGPS